jgi:hypothetical protein
VTGFFKNNAVSQIDIILIDGKKYSEKDIKEFIKNGLTEHTDKKKKKAKR